jgi:hypothetical protein
MNLKALGKMQNKTNVTATADVQPVPFRAAAAGALEMRLDAVSAEVDKIPLQMQIPFLRRKSLPVIATIGGFSLKLNPLSLKVETASVTIDGELGTGGMRANLAGGLGCETGMDVDGQLDVPPGMLGRKAGENDVQPG